MTDPDLGAGSQDALTPQDLVSVTKPGGGPGARKGHRKSLVQANMAESMKLKLLRAKAIRDGQRERLDSRHRYLLEYVSDNLKLDQSMVEDFMLDGDQVRFLNLYMYMYMYLIVVGSF